VFPCPFFFFFLSASWIHSQLLWSISFSLLVSGTLSKSLSVVECGCGCGWPTVLILTFPSPSAFADTLTAYRRTSAEWDHDKEKGCVFHFVGAMREFGKLGIIAVGDSPEEVDEIFEDAVATLVSEAKRVKEKLLNAE
jgi:PGM1 C-terminal domain